MPWSGRRDEDMLMSTGPLLPGPMGVDGPRRTFLSQLAWLVVLGLAPVPSWSESVHASSPDAARTMLGTLLPHTDSAVTIGQAYLRIAVDEREPTRLAGLIASDCGEPVFGSDAAAIRRCLSRRTRRDFAEGRVVTVRGWILAVTEARLCGLVALVLAAPEAAPRPRDDDRPPDQRRRAPRHPDRVTTPGG
jgi:hypothetical protein